MPRDTIKVERDEVWQKLKISPKLSREQLAEARPLVQELPHVERITFGYVALKFANLGAASMKLGKAEAQVVGTLNSIKTSLPKKKKKKKAH